MQSSKIKAKDGSTIELVDNRISDADITNWNGKLNVDGSNATNAGVTAMMRKVPSGTGHLSDESSYFGDSDSDHTQIVRRLVLDIWNYIKDKISSVLGLTASAYSGKAATAGTADKAVADNSGNNIEETYSTKTELSTHTSDTTVHITAEERTAWNNKLNVDGSNATNEGVTAIMRKVPSGSDSLNDESSYFGDSNSDHTQIVRRPVLDIWNYIKNKISSVLGLTASAYSGKAATAGTADKAVADNSGNNIEETYSTKTELSTHTSDTTVHITAEERTAWNAKQSALNFDTTPTAGSTNPVTSDGIKTALEVLQSNIDVVDAKGIVINEINGENVICFE